MQNKKITFVRKSPPFKAYCLRVAPTGSTFNKCALRPHCIYVFFYLPENKPRLGPLNYKLIGFYNRDEKFTARYGLGL